MSVAKSGWLKGPNVWADTGSDEAIGALVGGYLGLDAWVKKIKSLGRCTMALARLTASERIGCRGADHCYCRLLGETSPALRRQGQSAE